MAAFEEKTEMANDGEGPWSVLSKGEVLYSVQYSVTMVHGSEIHPADLKSLEKRKNKINQII